MNLWALFARRLEKQRTNLRGRRELRKVDLAWAMDTPEVASRIKFLRQNSLKSRLPHPSAKLCVLLA